MGEVMTIVKPLDRLEVNSMEKDASANWSPDTLTKPLLSMSLGNWHYFLADD